MIGLSFLLAAIVVTGGPDRAAVDELRLHLQLIGGESVAFAAHFDSTPVGGNCEGCAWEWSPTNTVFRGNARFAVIDFLENGLGVRWPDGKTVSYRKMDRIVPSKERGEWVPSVRKRVIRAGRGGDEAKRQNEAFRRRMRHGVHDMPVYGHAFNKWWGKYGKEHPEYFAMREDGLRLPAKAKPEDLMDDVAVYVADTKTTLGICPSSTGLVARIIADWREAGAKPFVNICENDIPGRLSCHCPMCRAQDVVPATAAADRDEHYHADRYVRFGNAVLAAARLVRSDARVCYYAYNGSRDAPAHERPDPTSLIGIVPTDFSYQALYDYVNGWKKAGMNEFFYRPNRHWYYTNHFLPTGQEKYFYGILRFLLKENAVGFDYDAPAAEPGGFEWFERYILYHAMQDPSKTYDYWVDHYCEAFGAAAPEVKAYYDYWRREKWEKTLLPNADELMRRGRFSNFGRGLLWTLKDWYALEDFAPAEAILSAAEAKRLDAPQAAALAVLRTAHEHAKLFFTAVTERTSEHAAQLLAFRRAHGMTEVPWSEKYWGDVTGIVALKEGREPKGSAYSNVVK